MNSKTKAGKDAGKAGTKDSQKQERSGAQGHALARGPQQTTGRPYVEALVWGVLGSAILLSSVWGLQRLSLGPLNHAAGYIYALLFERGGIQFLTVFVFWFTVGLLFHKSRTIREERQAFDLDCIKGFAKQLDRTHSGLAGAQTMTNLLVEVEGRCPDKAHLILVNRIIKALKQVKVSKSQAEVADVLDSVSGTDYAVMESSYSLIKFLIWIIPIFGFLGTLLGMSQAIGNFSGVFETLAKNGFGGLGQNLQNVTQGLALAFDTTLLALVASAILNFFANNLQKKEGDLLAQTDDFTLEYIINRFSEVKSRFPNPAAAGDAEEAKRQRRHEEMARLIREQGDKVVRELKNLQRQQQAAGNDNLAQLGRLIEDLGKLPEAMAGRPEIQKLAPDGAASEDLAALAGSIAASGETMKALLADLNEAIGKMKDAASEGEGLGDERATAIADNIQGMRQDLSRMIEGLGASQDDLIVLRLTELNQHFTETVQALSRLAQLDAHVKSNTEAIQEMSRSIRELARANQGLGNLLTGFVKDRYFGASPSQGNESPERQEP